MCCKIVKLVSFTVADPGFLEGVVSREVPRFHDGSLWHSTPGLLGHQFTAVLTVLGRYVLCKGFLHGGLLHAPLRILDFDYF